MSLSSQWRKPDFRFNPSNKEQGMTAPLTRISEAIGLAWPAEARTFIPAQQRKLLAQRKNLPWPRRSHPGGCRVGKALGDRPD